MKLKIIIGLIIISVLLYIIVPIAESSVKKLNN